MKRKTKTKSFKIALPLSLAVALFYCALPVFSFGNGISINEIMYDPEGSDSKREWIEILNISDSEIDFSNWKLFESSVNHTISVFQGSFLIKKGEYAVITDNAEMFIGEYPDYEGMLFDSSFSLSNSGEKLQLKNKSGEISAEASYEDGDGGKDNGFSLEIEDEIWRESFEKGGTPGKKNSEKPIITQQDKTLRLNEILPNTSGKEEEDEYIEIYNFGEEQLNLKGWSIKDASASGRYDFYEDFLVEEKDFRVIYRKDFDFALNNSGNESVSLISPIGETVSKVEYSGSSEDLSYNFDGNKWRWSGHLTPGKENIFNNLPKYSMNIPEESYRNIYAEFSVKANDQDGDDIKVVWDFGDGHKSYKKETRHKYLEKGKFQGILKISDGNENVFEKFEIEIKDLPHPKIKIVEIEPNPIGKDTKLETITIKNESKKKINLKGWSIATGWKKLINHPIREEFEIKAGKEKVLTRELSAFSLNNKKQKIEIRYPDGKVAYKLKYASEENIKEGIVYKKKKGGGWEWVQQSPVLNSKELKDNSNDLLWIIDNIAPEDIGKKSENEAEDIFERTENNFDFIDFPKNDMSKPVVLGANALWVDNNGMYRFIYESPEEEYYGAAFLGDFSSGANLKLNLLLNYFLN